MLAVRVADPRAPPVTAISDPAGVPLTQPVGKVTVAMVGAVVAAMVVGTEQCDR